MMKNDTWQPVKILSGALVFVLWAATAVLGLYEVFLVREMLFRIYARFWSSYGGRGRDYSISLTRTRPGVEVGVVQ